MFRLRDPSFVRRGRGGRAIAAASTVVPVVCLFTPAGLYPTWHSLPRNLTPHAARIPLTLPLSPTGRGNKRSAQSSWCRGAVLRRPPGPHEMRPLRTKGEKPARSSFPSWGRAAACLRLQRGGTELPCSGSCSCSVLRCRGRHWRHERAQLHRRSACSYCAGEPRAHGNSFVRKGR